MFVGESPWFVRPKGENSYDQTTGNQWNAFRSCGGLGNRRLQPDSATSPNALGLLCYYSCYYVRSIWPLPAPA
jgi:hypothetical protein